MSEHCDKPSNKTAGRPLYKYLRTNTLSSYQCEIDCTELPLLRLTKSSLETNNETRLSLPGTAAAGRPLAHALAQIDSLHAKDAGIVLSTHQVKTRDLVQLMAVE